MAPVTVQAQRTPRVACPAPAGGRSHPPRPRADQAGALQPPAMLVAARRARAEGRLSPEGLRAIEDAVIARSLERQHAAGIDVFTDGQFRRRAAAPAADATVDRDGRLAPGEAAFLRDRAPGPGKVAVPGPSTLALAGPRLGPGEEAQRAQLRSAAVAVRRELVLLAAEGASHVQVDLWAYGLSSYQRAVRSWPSARTDLERLLAAAIAADVDCTAGLARGDVTVAVQLCGLPDGLSGPVRRDRSRVAERLVQALPCDRVLVPCRMDSPGVELDVVRHLPPGRQAVLVLARGRGRARWTHAAARARLERAARVVGWDALGVAASGRPGTGCGGAQVIDEEDLRALRLVGRIARELWR